jgi:integrase
LDGGIKNVVHWNGSSVLSVKKAFHSAAKNAKLGQLVNGKFKTNVIPHTLRHSCATWLMQAGVEPWQAAGFLGMTVEMLERTYGHHSPTFQRGATEALAGKRRA